MPDDPITSDARYEAFLRRHGWKVIKRTPDYWLLVSREGQGAGVAAPGPLSPHARAETLRRFIEIYGWVEP